MCGFEEKIIHGEVEQVRKLPIAGLQPGGGGSKDPEITRLKKQDPDTEGVRVKLSGGEIHEPDSKKTRGKPASAVFEFQCDPDRTGLEGLVEEISDESRRRRRDEDNENDGDGKGDDKPNDDDRRSLRFKSFGPVDDKSYVLRMDWRTRYACENYVREHPKKSGGHWGFFTWLIIMSVFPILIFIASLSQESALLTDQCLPGRCCVPDFRVLAQLQPLRCTGLGPTSTRRHDPRHSVYTPGLDPTSRKHSARARGTGRIQCCIVR